MLRPEGKTIWGVIATLLGALALCTPVSAVPPVAERFEAYDARQLLAVQNGSLEAKKADGDTVFRWHINVGQTSRLSLRADHPLFARLRYYDRLHFEFQIASGAINSMNVDALGHVSGPRQYKVHSWHVAVVTTERNVWHRRFLDLSRPNWLPWDNPDGEGEEGYLRLEAMSIEPGTIVELRNMRLVRGITILKPDYELPVTWPVKTVNEDGSASYRITFQVVNASGRPTSIKAQVLSKHERFRVAFDPPKADLKACKVSTFDLTATMTQKDVAATPELYEEPLLVTFVPEHAPEGACFWEGWLVRPLSKTLRRQVVLSQDELKQIREGLDAGNADLKRLLNHDRTVAAADRFIEKRLDALPRSRAHVRNGYPAVPGEDRRLQPGSFMPEAVDPQGDFREVGTHLAGIVWKEYMAFSGNACDNLAMAYLMAGEEKYAQKAIELLLLYARQFTELPWTTMNDAPWHRGSPLLCSSRIASSSTYGSNWYMKGHCRLASAIAESPSWKEEDRKLVYERFVLPYVTEITKFPAPISNMTDITNHNLLLLGIAFDDAHLVRWATRTDSGVITRLSDIDGDGFSSEGRPINYHFAAMSEYLPAISFLENCGLNIDYPKERLLAAIRMPYLRADLSGKIPSTGDCGRGQGVRNNRLADYLVTVFPEERWLFEIGGASTVAKKLWMLKAGAEVDPEAWKKLLETKPRRFPEAGMAILRSGETPETQIMATLDYGRNVFHAALDRNHVALSAFGKIFTHGVGSLYNVGSGGMVRNRDPHLQVFCGHGSLGHNVIMVDKLDQLQAVGTLLAWNEDEKFQVAVSRVDGVRPGVSHTRALVLARGVLVMLDRVESEKEHTYDFVYHNFGELKLGDGWRGAPTGGPLGTTANYEHVVGPQKLTGTGPVRLTWNLTGQYPEWQGKRENPQAVKLAFWQLPVKGGQVFTGTTGQNNPNTLIIPDAAPSLLHRAKAKAAQFATVLEPHKGTPRVKGIETAEGGVTILFDDGPALTVTLDELLERYAVR